MEVRWALARVSSAVLGDITAVYGIPAFIPSGLKKTRGAVTAGAVTAVGPIGE